MRNVRQERRITWLVDSLRRRPRTDFDNFLGILSSDGINRIDIRDKLQGELEGLDRGKTVNKYMVTDLVN